MQKFFYPARLQGVVHAVPSKSEAHRRLICAGLTNGTRTIVCSDTAEDISATIACLKALGASVQREGDSLLIRGGGHPLDRIPRLECKESGSTLRFFVPIAMALTGGGIFVMRGRLSQRPMDIYRDLFVPRGAEWHMAIGVDGAAELHVSGRLEPGSYVLPGDVSSQFISGLLFALPLLQGDSSLSVKGPVESGAYIRMTLQALRDSGIQLEETGPWQWTIPGNQSYNALSCPVEGDWTQAAVLLCAGALGGEVGITGLNPDSIQGDREIVPLLQRLGAEIVWEGDTLWARGGNLRGTEADIRECPDLGPLIALVCQVAEGRSRITGVRRLRLKESDRLAATLDMLNGLGGQAVLKGGETIDLTGVSRLRGGPADTHRDHRMVMLASLAALVSEGPVRANGVEALSKSWPGYLETYEALGGRAE